MKFITLSSHFFLRYHLSQEVNWVGLKKKPYVGSENPKVHKHYTMETVCFLFLFFPNWIFFFLVKHFLELL